MRTIKRNITCSSIGYLVKNLNNSLEAADRYEFVHQGHCAAGWVKSFRENSMKDCFNGCVNRGKNIGYFAYNNENGDCACYQRSAECPDDEKFNRHNSYRIKERCK